MSAGSLKLLTSDGRAFCAGALSSTVNLNVDLVNGDQVTVRIDRRAYSPVLRQATLPPDTTVRWCHGRCLHSEFS